ncbi:hypothetical protein [Nocardia jinanensis]|uniref:Uncharacterized protein n=1 Tax=Nocardia jinanensis TaxID=382504 RepID=A0A917RGM6_9NOCA|nr:hypothetical protein [Nocardia jinanensis]GGL05708.1 hypothetical protein GCM10011588_20210 [Nocardia jinanensis]
MPGQRAGHAASGSWPDRINDPNEVFTDPARRSSCGPGATFLLLAELLLELPGPLGQVNEDAPWLGFR